MYQALKTWTEDLNFSELFCEPMQTIAWLSYSLRVFWV